MTSNPNKQTPYVPTLHSGVPSSTVSKDMKFVGRVKRFDSIRFAVKKKIELGPMLFRPDPTLESLSEESSRAKYQPDFVNGTAFDGVPDSEFISNRMYS